jgi:hypothetical protein
MRIAVTRGTGMSYARAAIFAGGAGALVGWTAMFAGVKLTQTYGFALFIASPILCGFISAVLFSAWHAPGFSGCFTAAFVSVALTGLLLILTAVEGLVCLVMALPLVMLGAALGGVAGYEVSECRRRPWRGPAGVALALLPMTFLAEGTFPPPAPPPSPVQSEIVVEAPPDIVWKWVISFPELPPATEWIFRAGVAAPVAAVIEGEGVGAIRRCRFTTGDFVEPIEVWDPPRNLTFRVTSEPDPMREMTLWRGPRPPHLDGFLESTRGQFILEPMPGGRTRLIGRTWYRTNMFPESYWRLWADPLIHAIHMKVLRHVASLAEKENRS